MVRVPIHRTGGVHGNRPGDGVDRGDLQAGQLILADRVQGGRRLVRVGIHLLPARGHQAGDGQSYSESGVAAGDGEGVLAGDVLEPVAE